MSANARMYGTRALTNIRTHGFLVKMSVAQCELFCSICKLASFVVRRQIDR